jgi:hypothetical protein
MISKIQTENRLFDPRVRLYEMAKLCQNFTNDQEVLVLAKLKASRQSFTGCSANGQVIAIFHHPLGRVSVLSLGSY